MFIQIEETPNHNALKFLVSELCEARKIFDYEREDTEKKPLFVEQLFKIPAVVRVFITSEFVTITKMEEESFDLIKSEIFQILFEAKINKSSVNEVEVERNLDELDEISKQIIEILDESDPKNLICRFNKSFLRESIY